MVQPVHSEGDQPWDFFGRNDAQAETPVLWPPHAKSWLIGRDSDAGRDWGQEEKGMTEDEMTGWHHWLNGFESEWTPGVGDGQGGLECCDSWGRKESDTTEWSVLTWTSVGKMISLLFYTLSRFVIAFLPGNHHLLISCLQSPSTVSLELKKKKFCHCFHLSPSICHEVMGLDALILFF